MNKITLYLMSLKGFMVLKSIIENNLTNIIEQIIIGKDINIQNDYSAEIVNLCNSHQIKHLYKNDNFEICSTYSLAISWRWLIPNDKSKLIVLHDSLLPEYRGFAPLVSMLINKEKKIGVTALFANENYDCGDIIFQSISKVTYPIKIADAIEKISENYIETVLYIIEKINLREPLIGIPQDNNNATYSLWRDDDDYIIDWNKNSKFIENFINSVGYPYNGASTFIDRKKIRILEAEDFPDVKIMNRTPGKIIFVENSYPIVVCGEGLLKLKKVVSDTANQDLLPFKNFRIKLQNSDENSIQ